MSVLYIFQIVVCGLVIAHIIKSDKEDRKFNDKYRTSLNERIDKFNNTNVSN